MGVNVRRRGLSGEDRPFLGFVELVFCSFGGAKLKCSVGSGVCEWDFNFVEVQSKTAA